MNKKTFKLSFGAVAAVITAMMLATTAFAAWYFLKPSDIAEKYNDYALSAAFKSDTAININKSVTSGDYTFTLLAIVSGKDITDHPTFSNGEIRNDRTYAVTAIQKADGSPMPNTMDDEYGNPSFYVSPYVKGEKPWMVNAHTLNGGYMEMVVDGVAYRILDCDEITVFADRGVYLGINTGSVGDISQAFIFNEQTGELKANPDYDGSNVVFDLPIDKKLADPAKAQEYLDMMWGDSDNTRTKSPDIGEGIDWEKATPITSTIKQLSVGAKGEIIYSYDTDEHGSGTITIAYEQYFEANGTAQSKIVHIVKNDDRVCGVRISVDEKGIITGMVVAPK